MTVRPSVDVVRDFQHASFIRSADKAVISVDGINVVLCFMGLTNMVDQMTGGWTDVDDEGSSGEEVGKVGMI